MQTSVVITIIIVALVSIMFLVAAINNSKVPQRRKNLLLSKLDMLKEQAESDELYARRDAIIKLDNLLSKALQTRYRNDMNCGENLKKAKKLFRKDTYQEIWDVHKLRNDIVHKDRDISFEESEKAYRVYKMSINKVLR